MHDVFISYSRREASHFDAQVEYFDQIARSLQFNFR